MKTKKFTELLGIEIPDHSGRHGRVVEYHLAAATPQQLADWG